MPVFEEHLGCEVVDGGGSPAGAGHHGGVRMAAEDVEHVPAGGLLCLPGPVDLLQLLLAWDGGSEDVELLEDGALAAHLLVERERGDARAGHARRLQGHADRAHKEHVQGGRLRERHGRDGGRLRRRQPLPGGRHPHQPAPGRLPVVTQELDDGRKVTCFPIRLDYALTVPKVQGMTLPHVTIWLDHAGCRAVAYVAMSRVQTDNDYLIAFRVSVAHFVPAH